MNDEKLQKFEDKIKWLQQKNTAILKKSSKFGVWLIVSGVIFTILIGVIWNVYAVIGFEKTLVMVLVMLLFTQARNMWV